MKTQIETQEGRHKEAKRDLRNWADQQLWERRISQETHIWLTNRIAVILDDALALIMDYNNTTFECQDHDKNKFEIKITSSPIPK